MGKAFKAEGTASAEALSMHVGDRRPVRLIDAQWHGAGWGSDEGEAGDESAQSSRGREGGVLKGLLGPGKFSSSMEN